MILRKIGDFIHLLTDNMKNITLIFLGILYKTIGNLYFDIFKLTGIKYFDKKGIWYRTESFIKWVEISTLKSEKEYQQALRERMERNK